MADELPYDSYNYDYREYIHYTPAPYIPSRTVSGLDFTYNGEGGYSVTQSSLKKLLTACDNLCKGIVIE